LLILCLCIRVCLDAAVPLVLLYPTLTLAYLSSLFSPSQHQNRRGACFKSNSKGVAPRVWKLLKSQYGLKQAGTTPRLFWLAIREERRGACERYSRADHTGRRRPRYSQRKNSKLHREPATGWPIVHPLGRNKADMLDRRRVGVVWCSYGQLCSTPTRLWSPYDGA